MDLFAPAGEHSSDNRQHSDPPVSHTLSYPLSSIHHAAQNKSKLSRSTAALLCRKPNHCYPVSHFTRENIRCWKCPLHWPEAIPAGMTTL